MRNVTRVSLVLAGSAALVGSMALPASAADTTTTVTVPNEGISISAAPTSDLGSIVPGQTASITLPGVQVTDKRAGTTNWTATVSSSDFESGANVIDAVNASYTAGNTQLVSGIATLGSAGKQSDLTEGKGVLTASAITGNNVATWDGTLELAVPSNALAGVYTATVVHSVS